MKMFSVYDSKAEAYMRPFFAEATGQAIRSFSDEVNSGNKDSMVALHPGDFTLFELAYFNDGDGHLEVLEAKKSLGCGLDFVRSNLKAAVL